MNVRVRLTERWVDHVRGLPETGMGYQIVDVVLRNGKGFRGIVVRNAEEMEWPSGAGEMVPEDIVEITQSGVRPQDEPRAGAFPARLRRASGRRHSSHGRLSR